MTSCTFTSPIRCGIGLAILLFLFPLLVFSQEQEAPVRTTAKVEEVAEPELLAVRPLDELIQDALVHAPLLKVQALNVDNAYHKAKLIDKEWSNYFNAIGSAQLGNIRYLDNLESDSGADIRTITRENVFYGIGVQLRLPLNDFMTRNDRKAILQNQLEQEKLLRQEREIKVRELVIRQYHELQLKLKLITLRTRELEAQNIAVEMAERYFREGNLSLHEYTAAASQRNLAEEALAGAQTEALISYQLLRELVGKDIALR